MSKRVSTTQLKKDEEEKLVTVALLSIVLEHHGPVIHVTQESMQAALAAVTRKDGVGITIEYDGDNGFVIRLKDEHNA